MWWHKNLNWLSTKVKIVLKMKMKTKAIYEGDVLKPIGKLDLNDGMKVEIEVKKKITERTFGIIQLEHEEIEEIITDTEYGSW
jgi:predicted DNA-binding antitoxin AbrB/MazE fold protein